MQFLPRPSQELAINRMLATDYQLLALRMGAGKTSVALTVINEMMFNMLTILDHADEVLFEGYAIFHDFSLSIYKIHSILWRILPECGLNYT